MAWNNKNNKNIVDNTSTMGCVTTIILGIIAMPLAGVFLLITGKSAGTKIIGILLLILGIVFWRAMA